MAQQIDARTNAEWYADGPTTHLTEDGDSSLCGGSEVPDQVETHELHADDELYLCERCAELAD